MWRIGLLFLCCTMTPSACAASPEKPASVAATSVEIDRAVQSLCSKQVVLLGEDSNHGGATTIAVKARLLQRLVQQCGFRGVVFESQFYDMLDFEHAIASKSATREKFSDAIGAVWSRYTAFVPLENWLFDEAQAGHVRVAGMDPQVGGITGHYSEQTLAVVLSSVLPGDRRTECRRTIGRHNAGEYDDAHPFDAVAMFQLRACLQDIHERLTTMKPHAPSGVSAMAESYANYLEFADGGQPSLRDRAMYDNFVWIRGHWPQDTRIVIWCASVHAAKTLEQVNPTIRPLGSYIHGALGAGAAAIGFSALGGSYGNVGGHAPAHRLDAAASGSLETRALAGAGARSLRFMDREQLKALGPVSARALNYSKVQVLDWSHVLDGMIVMRTETATKALP